MTYSVHDLFQRAFLYQRIRNTRNFQLLGWSGSHHQRRPYPRIEPVMQYYCFDNTDQVLYHLTREQHLNWPAQVDIVRMNNQAGKTQGRLYEHVLQQLRTLVHFANGINDSTQRACE